MGITEFLVVYITAFINSTGYLSIFVLMAFESMILPVPSEAVMPFAGFLVASGRFTFAGVIAFSTMGSIVGSTISYYIGSKGGRPLITKYGKYLLLNNEHLEMTEKFFTKHGDITIFISRMLPVVRHLISIPAGMGKMNIYRFLIYTIIGAAIWNGFLTWVGFVLKNNWDEILKYTSIIDIVIVAVLCIVVLFTFYKLYKSYRNKLIKRNV